MEAIFFHLLPYSQDCCALYSITLEDILAQGSAESKRLENPRSIEISCKLSKIFLKKVIKIKS